MTADGPSARRQLNVVLINCDDLGYGDLGCYGSTRNDTPVLDRMAAQIVADREAGSVPTA